MKSVLSVGGKNILSHRFTISDEFISLVKDDFEASFVLNKPQKEKQVFERDLWIVSKNIIKLQDLIFNVLFDEFEITDDDLFYYQSWLYRSDKNTNINEYHTHDYGYNVSKVYPVPSHTFVFYVSMPENDEGKIWFRYNGENNSYKPSIGELLVFPTDLPHKPEMNHNSDIPRLVYAGNFKKINKNYNKKTQTLI